MKRIIFLCLLSLSVCFSKPAVEQAPQVTPQGNAANVTGVTVNNTEHTLTANVTDTQSQKANAPTEPKPHQNETEVKLTTLPPPLPPKTTINTKPAIDNKTTNKQTPPKENGDNVTTQKTIETNVTTEKINPTEKAKDEVTTEKTTPKTADVPKTTEAPKSDADKHVLQARGFDGASFIGGIILTLGLLAIGFMGFKYYKNQTERNYHTL